MPRALVTGGSGYFGSLMIAALLERGYGVRSLDVSDADDRPAEVELVRADIRDPGAVRGACEGMDVVFHNVAQVPLAKDPDAFRTVNVDGTRILLDACRDAGVGKVVNTSSSAVYGVPAENPVREDTDRRPAEAYGRAKLDAEHLCRAAVSQGLDVSIVRPRTILGHGRLGIFTLVFDWIDAGADVFVLGKGDNRYQFVHAEDLADACIRAGERSGPAAYNVGTDRFGTMREALEGLIAHAGQPGHVRSLPMAPAAFGMQALSRAGFAPFAAYHWIMFGRSMWFDTTRTREDLGWAPRWSNDEMLGQSYDWYLAHRRTLAGGASHHRSPVRAGALGLARRAFVRSR